MPQQKLVIFDIDGTLTDSVSMDATIFTDAFKHFLQCDQISGDWQDYQYSTDSGFSLEIFQKHLGRSPQAEEIQQIQQHFFQSLQQQITAQPACCRAVAGAKNIFHDVTKELNWDTAIATGGWQTSARMKLKHAAIDYKQSPFASGDDHIERYEIINIAIERAKQHYNKTMYDQVVYVGDRSWDFRAAQELQIGFIGVGDALKKEAFPIPIINDYCDDSLIELLRERY